MARQASGPEQSTEQSAVVEIPLTSELVESAEQLRPDDYLAANADVRAAGMDAMEHFRAYGIHEGRRQRGNVKDLSVVQAIRREKLSRVRFNSDPIRPTEPGEALDYLPDEIRQGFEIPDDVPVAQNDYHQEIVDIIRANPSSLMLDVGAGFRHTYYSNVVNAEIWAAASTDVVCVGEELPFEDNQFDYVFCLAVLEHTKRPWIACREIIRVLKPGGHVRIDWPFLQPFHGYPHHFFNATSVGAVSMFEDSCDVVQNEVKLWQHPIFVLAWLLEEWNKGLPPELQQDFANRTIGEMLSTSREALVYQPFCSALPAAVQDIISAGTTITCRKR